MIDGGCFCKAVRYTVDEGDYVVVNCHCSMCRKTSGAPFVTWLTVPRDIFRWTQGEPKCLQSSEHGNRYFCPECGTHMAFITMKREEFVDITTGSLDRPEDFVPTRAVHEDSKLPWLPATEILHNSEFED